MTVGLNTYIDSPVITDLMRPAESVAVSSSKNVAAIVLVQSEIEGGQFAERLVRETNFPLGSQAHGFLPEPRAASVASMPPVHRVSRLCIWVGHPQAAIGPDAGPPAARGIPGASYGGGSGHRKGRTSLRRRGTARSPGSRRSSLDDHEPQLARCRARR